MLDATRTTTRQRILDMYASNNNNIFAAGAAADLDRATTARPGVYDGVGTWFAQSYQPAYGDLTARRCRSTKATTETENACSPAPLEKGRRRRNLKENGREGFRLAAKTLYLTYPKCDLSPAEALGKLKALLPPMSEYIVAQEKHKVGTRWNSDIILLILTFK